MGSSVMDQRGRVRSDSDWAMVGVSVASKG